MGSEIDHLAADLSRQASLRRRQKRQERARRREIGQRGVWGLLLQWILPSSLHH